MEYVSKSAHCLSLSGREEIKAFKPSQQQSAKVKTPKIVAFIKEVQWVEKKKKVSNIYIKEPALYGEDCTKSVCHLGLGSAGKEHKKKKKEKYKKHSPAKSI